MTRVATDKDWHEVRDKVHAFNDAYYDIPVSNPKLRTWFNKHLTGGVIILSEGGLISGLFMEDPVRHWEALVETAWYDSKREGLRLLEDFVQAGRHRQCDEVRMTTLNTTPAGVTTLLNRMGFEEIERSHRLTL